MVLNSRISDGGDLGEETSSGGEEVDMNGPDGPDESGLISDGPYRMEQKPDSAFRCSSRRSDY